MSTEKQVDAGENANKTTIFAVRTTIGQEKSVLQNMFNRLRVLNPFPDLKAMMIANELRGYVFVEATHQRDVMIAISGLRHVKGKVVGSITLESISHVISPRKVTEILEAGDTVEIISGIFMSQKAQVIRMPKEGAKEEVTLRLLDSDSAISIKIHGDFLKLLQKGEKHKEEYIIKEMDTAGGTTKPVASNSSSSATSGLGGGGIKVSGGEESALSDDVFSFDEDDDDSVTELSDFGDTTKMKKPSKKKDADGEDEEDDEWAKFGF